MKKSLLGLIALLTVPAWAVTVTVDGNRLPPEPAPIISEGRVLVPLRAVFQALEADVDYRDSTITATRDGQKVVLRPGERSALVNGSAVALDAPARLQAGTTYVPLRFVAQALGEEVAWDSSSKSVTIGGEGLAQSGPSTRIALKPKLQQLLVGNQGGVLKVRDASGQEVYYRGLDDRSVAPLSPVDQERILSSLGLSGHDLAGVARQTMGEYSSLPQKEALALLGVLNSLPPERLDTATSQEIRTFLSERMRSDATVHNRRQAVLALAVGSTVEPTTVEAVLDFYTGSENLWETFPVQQFFEYHADRLQQMTNFAAIKQQALSVNSLYRENISNYLGG